MFVFKIIMIVRGSYTEFEKRARGKLCMQRVTKPGEGKRLMMDATKNQETVEYGTLKL